MNVGLVNHWYPPEAAAGGVGKYNTTLSEALVELGHCVVVVSSTLQSKPRLEAVNGTPVIRLPRPQIPSRLDRLLILGRQMRALRTWLYARRVARALPEIVEQYKLEVLEYADIEAEALFHHERIPLPYVVRLHGPLFVLERYYQGKEQPFGTSFIKRMERRAVTRADAWSAPSHYIAQLVASAYALPESSIKAIPNPYSLDSCTWSPPSREKLVVLFVGRLERLKGADTFAEAIPQVLTHNPNIHFLYVAWDRPRPDGSSMKSFLIRQLRAGGALANVEFLTSNGDGCLYARFKPDICVVPSRIETFSYPCFEAMAHSIPVVASRTAALPELVEDGGNGILFEPGNATELAEGILRLAVDPALRRAMGRAGREKAVREYDKSKLVQEIVRVYEQTRTRYVQR
jgi:glycosyltransferase involved in cell wall biosynthesis